MPACASGTANATQAVTYLATAPKSNAVYKAYLQAASGAREDRAEPVPMHLRNAPARLMKQLDYGKDYHYARDDPVKIREMMVTAVNHEITPREPHNGYLILQGGLPEVEAFVKQHWK